MHLELSVTFMGINQTPRAAKRCSGKSRFPMLGRRGPGCERSQILTTSHLAELGAQVLCTASGPEQDTLGLFKRTQPLSLSDNLPPPEDQHLTRNPNGRDLRLEPQIYLI